MKVLKLISFFLFFVNLNLQAQQNKTFDSLTVEFNKLKEVSNINKKDKTILKLLNSLYDETLQADDGSLSQKTIAKYQAFKEDSKLANWPVFYLFETYQNEITQTELGKKKNNKDLRVALMKILSGELIDLYQTIPPIILVYMGEALMNSGANSRAQNHFKMSLEFYPESIPLKVYSYLLADDKTAKEAISADLTKNHKNHWMVKQFLTN
ncbi:hypothetical protein [Flavobacterium sp. 102]|uniref:hypothetical protein n=1 Tax=Flavobacterium sp. 102 TaxID=2135623 RepID=UPI000EB56FF9|nr:hypothetical protein [Flavobacterium sp. 102]RKS03632.1 hypothetical protein C8C84_3393 [Flavobacterium sp. 102]